MIPTPPLPPKLNAKIRLSPALTATYGIIALVALGAILIAAKSGSRPPQNALAKKPKSAVKKIVASTPLQGVTVILDPGHGGIDSGSICSGTREDALNYRLTATIGAALKNAGAKIVYTVRSKSLNVNLEEGRAEPALIIPEDARLAYDGTTILGNKKSLGARAAVGRPYREALSSEQKRVGSGLYFLAVHHDENKDVRGGRIEYDNRGGDPPLLALVLTQRMSLQTFVNKLTSWCRKNPDSRHLWVLKPANNPIPQRALLEAATISHPKDRDLANSRQFRWKMANMVRDSLVECEKTLKKGPVAPIRTASSQFPSKISLKAVPSPGVRYDRSLIAARGGSHGADSSKTLRPVKPIVTAPAVSGR
jgi:N-acetylmuramoyl-L-alanine amidase